MSGFLDKLGDLSWLGPDYENQGWFEVGERPDPVDPPGPTLAEIALEQAESELKNSIWAMLDDAPLTVEQKQEWIEYRNALRNIQFQPGFPNDIQWPVKPI